MANVADLLDRQLVLLNNRLTNEGLPANLVARSGADRAGIGDRRNNRPLTVEGKVRRGSGEGKKAGFGRIEGGRGRRGRKG